MEKGMASLMKMKIQNFLYFALKMKNKNVCPLQFSFTAYFLKFSNSGCSLQLAWGRK